MRIYKIAKVVLETKDYKGRRFYVHEDAKCKHCGGKRYWSMSYDPEYICRGCGGHFVEETPSGSHKGLGSPTEVPRDNWDDHDWDNVDPEPKW